LRVTDSLIDLADLRLSAEGFLGAVLQTVGQPIWVVDPDDRIRFANPAAIATLGYGGADELLGRQSHETIHFRHPDGSPYPAADCPLRLPRTTGERVTSELDWFFRRDGSAFPVSYVSAPIGMPEGRGAVVAFVDITDRLRAEQVQREHDEALASQQASLRRVATLVTSGAASAEVFAAIAREVGHVIGLPLIAVWRYEPDNSATVIGAWSEQPQPFHAGTRWQIDGPTITAKVRETGRPARIDDFADLPGTVADAARSTGIRSCAGAPIIVGGDVWGVMSADSTDTAPLPDHIEDRLAEFTELIATAISNTASRDELARLADEQAALRRVATLVARGVPPPEVFAAVAREVGLLLGVDATHMGRYEADGAVTNVASWSRSGNHMPVGMRVELEGERVGRDDSENAAGTAALLSRELGLRASVGAPVLVDGSLWGVMMASSMEHEALPADTDSRIAAFTELVATAISNTEARTEVRRLAEEQAALRRVATLVARGVPPGELFDAVTKEVGALLGADLSGMIRYVTGGTLTAVATWSAEGEHPEVRGMWPLEGDRLATTILSTSRPAREDDWAGASGPIAVFVREELGVRSSVGSPIVVEGQVWGALFVHSKKARPLSIGTEPRLAEFTELVATAISNTQARAEVRRLADEQTALRRVATLVAHDSSSSEVFAAVAEELGRLLAADATRLVRFEEDETATVLARWGQPASAVPVGTRLPLGGQNVISLVARTGRPARMDDYSEATGAISAYGRKLDARSAVGGPIVVGGRLWGAVVVTSRAVEAMPAGTEAWIEAFAELIATAIANIQARSELAASRARVVAAADHERRRMVRDLHDGAQQRLVHTVITLKLARRALETQDATVPTLVAEALEQAEDATAELRELVHGILPAVLTGGGLRTAVESLATRMPIPIEIGVSVGRLPAAVEATAYFVVAEALTNVAKHARARHASVTARVGDGTMRVEVRDDGVGRARPGGSGLIGLADRLAVLHGALHVDSPARGGTVVTATIPLPDEGAEAPMAR
jgi:PAS domain S-box-containing protein